MKIFISIMVLLLMSLGFATVAFGKDSTRPINATPSETWKAEKTLVQINYAVDLLDEQHMTAKFHGNGISLETIIMPEGTGSRVTVKVTGGKRDLYLAPLMKRASTNQFFVLLERAINANGNQIIVHRK